MVIEFSHNWNNKLNNTYFTSIRQENLTKYIIGKLYDVILKDELLKHAILVDIRKFQIKDLTNYMACLDTGYSKEESLNIFSKMYKIDASTSEKVFYFLLFKTIK
jgi:hypothetical protein